MWASDTTTVTDGCGTAGVYRSMSVARNLLSCLTFRLWRSYFAAAVVRTVFLTIDRDSASQRDGQYLPKKASRHMSDVGVTSTDFRVRYAETDQMGVAHHSNYLIWCEQARTDHMRSLGASYRNMEEQGLLLPVVDAKVRFRAAARYDDALRVSCWVREISSRRVIFGYVVQRIDDSRVLATAETSLMAVNSAYERTTIPEHVRQKLVPVVDPVRM